MKFRKLHFRLFPKIRSKKKNRASKQCNYDYARDIGLDRNCNYSRNSYYDNVVAETQLPYDKCLQQTNEDRYRKLDSSVTYYDNASYGKLLRCSFPLPELRVNIDSTCGCIDCAGNGFDQNQINNPFYPYPRDAGSVWIQVETPSDSCSTIPRARTRIKTNPWLPSPKATPSASPTDPIIDFLPVDVCNMKASRMSLPLPVPVPKGRTEVAAHAGSCTIPGFHECTDDNIMYFQPVLKTCPFKSKMKRSQNLDFRSLQNGLTGNDILSKYRARSPSVDAYDTDISRSPSPVIDNSINESFHLGFIYEDTIDDLLETSTIVRDDTFESLKDQTKPKEDPKQDRNSPLLESKYQRLYYPVEKDLSPSPSAPSCSISEKLETTFDESVTQNMQASIDTGYASGTPHDIDSDSMSSSGDLDTIPDHVSEVELEWDNDPSTHTLLADSPIANNLTSQVKPPYLMSHKHITEMDIACVQHEGTHNAMVDLYCVTQKFEDKNNENYVQCTFTIPRKHQNPQVSVGSKKYRRRSRSLADLDLTLEEKVIMLREEKAMVQRKIQDSILEDRKRRYEKDKNKSEKAEYKSAKAESKTLLWKTLQDLKTRLEGQSERLQSSYQAIQTLRARFTPRRQTLTVMETHV